MSIVDPLLYGQWSKVAPTNSRIKLLSHNSFSNNNYPHTHFLAKLTKNFLRMSIKNT